MFPLRLALLVLLIGPHWLVTRDMFNGAATAFSELIANTDGLYWDLLSANWLVGVAFLKFCFWLAHGLGVDYILVVRSVTTLMLLGLYLEFIWLGRRLFDFSVDESQWVALLCLASPSLYTLMGGTTVVPNPLCFWFMYMGHRLYWQKPVWQRLAGLALMTVSFQVASNLVFSLALDVAFLYHFADQRRDRWPWLVLLFSMTLAVYGTMRGLSPPSEFYVNYNQLLNPLQPDSRKRLVMAILKFLTWGILPIAAVLVALAASRLFARRDAATPAGAGAARSDWQLLVIAGFLCASAAFPYVMVGKGPALFHWVGIGDGVVEQLLRASHDGPLAPRWETPTLQHGTLFAAPCAILCWLLARMVMRRGRVWHDGRRVHVLFLFMLPAFLVWVLPAYMSKLDTQASEISLRKGLAKLPAPPPGLVDLKFTPVKGWLFWVGSANIVMREAWGHSWYFGMFYQIDAVRDDELWQYHTSFLDIGGMTLPRVQHVLAMDGFPGADCISHYRANLPMPDLKVSLLAGWMPDLVPSAEAVFVGTDCQPGRVVPNPTPGKAVIP